MKKFIDVDMILDIVLVLWSILSTLTLATMGLDFTTTIIYIVINSFILIFGIGWRYK